MFTDAAENSRAPVVEQSKSFGLTSRASIPVSILCAAAIAGLLLGLLYFYDKFTQSQESWRAYSEDSVAVDRLLGDLNANLGYTGFIHSFKNFVLREDYAYYDDAVAHYDAAQRATDGLRAYLADPVSESALDVIAQTMGEYRRKLEFAANNYETLTIAELDEHVRVVDDGAIRAFETITSVTETRLAARKRAADDLYDEVASAITIGSGAIAFILAAGGFILLLFRRIEHSSKKERHFRRQAASLFNGSSDALFLVDDEGRIVRWNDKASHLFGYGAGEMDGLPVERLVPERMRAGHAGHRARYAETGGDRPMSSGMYVNALRKDGGETPIFVALKRAPAFGETMTLVTCRDVRPALHATARMDEAARMAKEAQKTRSDFLATVSHELRTPLNAIIGFSELLTMSGDGRGAPSRSAEYAEHISKSGRHLLGIVNNILDFARSDTEEAALEISEIDVQTFLHSVRARFDLAVNDKPLTVSITADDSVPARVFTDEQHFTQIVDNLIGNAIKFTETGRVDVTISSEAADDRGAMTVVRVRDTGIGIEAADMDRIFDPFSQADSSITREHGGAGLGLAISRRLARCLGGDLVVESVPGEGSLFTLSLPDRNAVAGPPAPAPAPRAVDDDLCVLVVDDAESNAVTAQAILRENGAKMVWAPDGLDAMQAMRDRRFDLILVDLHMPGMDGFETVSRLREIEAASGGARAPIYAWTADLLSDFEYGTERLFDGVVTKPTFPDDLIALLPVAHA